MGKGPILAIMGILLCTLGLGGYVRHIQTQAVQEPRIGVVRLQDVVEKHPNFHSYDEQKKALLQLEAQRDREEEVLQSKLGTEMGKSEEELKKLEASLSDSVQRELQTKVALREAELQQALANQQQELLERYRKDYKMTPTQADIEIVNLQLALTAIANTVPIDESQKRRWEAEKQVKEAKLSDLLAQRNHSVTGSSEWESIQSRVAQEMQPAYDRAHRQLADYATELAKELGAQRDSSMKRVVDSQQDVVKKVHQEGTQLWNAEWDQRLAQKRDEVQALHDAILEDIRVRAGVIARAKHLDLVLVDHITDRTGMDLTDEIIKSYGQ